MEYKELTLDQRISLKGFFQTEQGLERYNAVMILWGFVAAVELFLNDDPSILRI